MRSSSNTGSQQVARVHAGHIEIEHRLPRRRWRIAEPCVLLSRRTVRRGIRGYVRLLLICHDRLDAIRNIKLAASSCLPVLSTPARKVEGADHPDICSGHIPN